MKLTHFTLGLAVLVLLAGLNAAWEEDEERERGEEIEDLEETDGRWVDAFRKHHHHLHKEHQHRHHHHRHGRRDNFRKLPKLKTAKIVNYAFVDVYGSYQIREMPVKSLEIEPSKSWAARSLWSDNDYNTTGWSFLEIETNEKLRDHDQAFAAGLLEGTVTRELISLHLLNTVGDFCADESAQCKKLTRFLTSNFKWMQDMIDQHPEDPYWHQVDLLFWQFKGLYFGYYNITPEFYETRRDILGAMAEDIKPYLNLLALQLNGDMSELLASFNGVSNPFIAGSCSALIKVLGNNADLLVSHDTWGPYEVMLKVLPDQQDLLVSHNTWTVYESMLRVLKHYKLNYHLNKIDPTVIAGSEIAFSSYPGILSSIDDFYVINSGLTVMETTIGNSNTDLWKYVTPETNLYWVRNLVANRLSFTGVEWAKWFSLHNSGTYNNEWMIVDYKRFLPNMPLQDNLLIVLEQLPGQTVWNDKTDVLREQSYWPSYNLAYYPEVYNISGTYDAYLKYGSFFSYEESPRASIFRRDHSNVVDIPTMIDLMRYANFTEDPLSKCDCDPPYSGENTIAARSDVNPANGRYPFDALGHRDHGATDMKLTSWKMSQNMEFIGICGPSYGFPGVQPFRWSEADFGNSTNHFGHPDLFMFEPIHVRWNLRDN